jgi:hypothetical protein
MAKRIPFLLVVVLLAACSIPSTPQIVILTAPPVEVTREVQVTRLVEVTPDLYTPGAIWPLITQDFQTYAAGTPTPTLAFDNLTWTRDVAVPRICIGQGVAFKIVLEGKPGTDVAYHINHYDGEGVKVYRSHDFTGTIEADGKLVKVFQESFPYMSKWRAQLVITWPLPLVTRNASVTVDCQ